MARHLSPPDARRHRQLRHADDQQRRRRQGAYRTAFVYDFTWILPFAFFPWAATLAPASKETDAADDEEEELSRPRPWVIFTAVALLPFLDYGLRRIAPDEAFSGFRDLSTAITIISVLPLLVARIAAERAELQQAGATMRLLAQVIEQAKDLILVMTADGRCRHANDAFCRAMNCTREELHDQAAARPDGQRHDLRRGHPGGGAQRRHLARHGDAHARRRIDASRSRPPWSRCGTTTAS